MAGGSTAIVRAPWQGLDTSAAPTSLRPDRAPIVTNFLPGREPGKLVLRGPIPNGVATTPKTDYPGYWSLDHKTLFRTAAGTLQVADASGAVSLSATFAIPANFKDMLRKWAQYGTFTYGVTMNASGVFTDAYLYRWDGSAATGGVVQIANGPNYNLDVAVWLDRVITLGYGYPGGGISTSIDNVSWTDPGWDGTDTLAKWQDDVSGLTNRLDLSRYNIQAHTLCVYQNALYVLGNEGIVAIRGSAPSNWTVRQVTTTGCGGTGFTRSAVVTDEGIYFMSNTGLVLFDGVSITVVGGDVRRTIGSLVPGVLTFNPGTITSVDLHVFDGEWLGVTSVNSSRWLGFHRPTRTWCEFTTGLFSGSVPKRLGTTETGRSWATDDAKFVKVSGLTRPESLATSGVDTANTTSTITATSTSRSVVLATPSSKAQLRRVMADVLLQSPAVSSQPTITVSAIDDAGTVLGSIVITSTTTATRQRAVFDVFKESDATQLKWDLTTNGQTVTLAEVHDASMEFTPGQDRTG